MRKVTTINLNGRAYQLEEPAYDKLQAYLQQAEKTLAGSPDKSEVIADIEQSIADKCERALEPGKNVVSSEQMADILERMGEVESSDDGAAEPKQSSTTPSGSAKRLFLIRDGAMLMGVSQGLAAYLGIDVSIIRIVFIILTFITSGFAILVYLLLGIVLPTAKTEAELAEAHGRPVTAQDIVERARERAPDSESLQRFSNAAMRIIRLLSKVVRVVLAVAFGILTAAWLLVQIRLLTGHLQFDGQLAPLNGWRQWLMITALYLIVAVPVWMLSRLFDRLAEDRKQTTSGAVSESSLGVLWGLAIVTIMTMIGTYGQSFRDYAQTHQGYIQAGDHRVCVDEPRCNPDGIPKRYELPGDRFGQ